MSVLRFQIRQPNGQVDQLFIESERVLIGSGAHCEIRLPIDQSAVEHALVQVTPAGVYVQALSFQPPPTLNGVPITQGPLPPDGVLAVGQFQMTVAVAEGVQGGGGAVVKKKKAAASPLTFVALLMIGGAGYYFLNDVEPQDDTTPPTDAPELFAAPIVQCTQRGQEQALALAHERNSVADAKRERRPFHPQDGVNAVPLYELAAACYRVAGDNASATDTAGAAAMLRKEMADDYRTHRVRLDHFLNTPDPEPPAPPLNLLAARREVHTLLEFTEGKQGEYVTWLQNLDRKLKLKLGRAPS